MLLLNQQAIVQANAAAYDPGMMTYDGSTGYYHLGGLSASGNQITALVRFNTSNSTSTIRLFDFAKGPATFDSRMGIALFGAAAFNVGAGELYVICNGSTPGEVLFRGKTNTAFNDGQDHVLFYSFNAATGDVNLYADGVDVEDATYVDRVLTTGTLVTGTDLYVGTNAPSKADLWDNDIGYVGVSGTYLTNPTDFYHPTNGLQEIDESGWTEWGAQPLFWNQYGQMTDNKGSAGNMTANGTITGPA